MSSCLRLPLLVLLLSLLPSPSLATGTPPGPLQAGDFVACSAENGAWKFFECSCSSQLNCNGQAPYYFGGFQDFNDHWSQCCVRPDVIPQTDLAAWCGPVILTGSVLGTTCSAHQSPHVNFPCQPGYSCDNGCSHKSDFGACTGQDGVTVQFRPSDAGYEYQYWNNFDLHGAFTSCPRAKACGTVYPSYGECRTGIQCGSVCEGARGPEPERCDGLDNDCDGVIDNGLPGCDTPQPPDCEDDPKSCQCDPDELGGPTSFADPVAVAATAALLGPTDLEFPTSVGAFRLIRKYQSGGFGWQYGGTLGTAQSGCFLPTPFGYRATSYGRPLDWWHNFYSMVDPRSWYTNDGLWFVKNTSGATRTFKACGARSTPCVAVTTASNNTAKETFARLEYRLQADGGPTFVYSERDGLRYYYDALWQAPDAGVAEQRLFLGRVEDTRRAMADGGALTLYSLTYAPPPGGCPLGAGDSGVPYLAKVTTQDGAQVLFHYKRVASTSGIVPNECVIDWVGLVDRPGGGVTQELPVVRYHYPLDAGVETGGFVSSVDHPQSSRSESYALATGAVGVPYNPPISQTLIVSRVGTPIQAFGLSGSSAYGWTSSFAIPEGSSKLSYSGAAGDRRYCLNDASKPYCTDVFWTYNQPTTAMAGDGTFGTAPLIQTYVSYSTGMTSREVVHQVVDACSGASCLGASPGATLYEFQPMDAGVGKLMIPLGVQDKRGNWLAFSYSSVVPDGGVERVERRTIWTGASALSGTGALERADSAYGYGNDGTQLQTQTWQSSVLASGQSATARFGYDLFTNRLVSTIRSGYTKTFANGTWSGSAVRYVGTFNFTRHVCSSGSQDPLGRTLEVHGPCLVSGPNATDCSAGTVPITQYAYYGATGDNRANRLQSVTRFVNASATNCSSATALRTTLQTYDAFGNATSVADENGQVTQLTYLEGHVATSSKGGALTTFAYDNGMLSAVHFPQGNYEVSCYRSGTSGPGCSGGTWTKLLQWRAKSAVADGSTWSEKVVYSYWPDGTIRAESYRGACASGCSTSSGEVRRVVQHAADPHRRPSWEQQGDATGSFASARFFDRSNNLAGIGVAYNSPPAFCGGASATSGSGMDKPLSTLCTALSYDAANRLNGLDEYPTSAGSATRTCLGYDAQGNVSSVRVGCSGGGTPGDCSGCSWPPSTYQYDDFGNVISATLPWTDTGSGAAGTTKYSYDAAGHLLVKQTPAMAQTGDYLTYAYDSLGRTVSLTHHYTQPSAGNELLYTFAYDNAATLDPSCPQPSNTLGRTLYRNDSFGTTWYEYDAWGRVTEEIRLRTGTTNCLASNPNLNPHTTYAYSTNGDLTSITYPYGRTVTFGYGTGANADRATNISITTWNGTAWSTKSNIISAIAWEPYGGVRGYQINHPTTANASAVEYLLGDNGSVAPAPGCPSSIPNTASSDHTGRVRGLWVSTGSFTPGSGNGATYKRTYTWQADQLKQEDTCLLGATAASTVTYGYDQLLRLTSAGRPAGNFASAGGSIGSRTFALDGPGNRISETREDCSYPDTYGQSAFPDRLTRQSSGCSGAILKYNYAYDRDGRAATKSWPVDSSGDAGTVHSFASGDIGAGTHGALDSVFKSVSISGAVYNYYYDAFNRRRLKVYPAGPMDEAFHDTANDLLVDQGNDGVVAPTAHPTDEYVWLGGHPIMVIRSKLSTAWARFADSTGDCTRNGDAAPCGFYFPVTDRLGKPVLMLDASRRVTGAAEYDVFGFPNRVSLNKETAHPYANSANLTLADFTQAIGGTANPSTRVRLRAIFDVVDTEGPVATPADYVFLKDPDGGAALTSHIGGPHRGQVWSPWVMPSAGRVQVPFLSNGSGNTYTGVVLAGYEYQRFQVGAQPFWTPLRFPGQYHDAETDLFQNWNRFYDPAVGRYLEPEPMLGHPTRLTFLVAGLSGHSVPPAYGYANNNPVHFTDKDGRCSTTYDCCLERHPDDPEFCASGNADPTSPNPDRTPQPGDPTPEPPRNPGTLVPEPMPPTPPIPGPSCEVFYAACIARCKDVCGNPFTKSACVAGCTALYIICKAKPGSH
jgi:RHS repeat-associated protein